MIQNINLYSTSICNLACKYCFIPKNKALQIIDKKIEESFKDKNYYYNLANELCGDLSHLNGIEIWGGEPTLHMERVYDTIDTFINKTDLKKIFFSTNFCTDSLIECYYNFGNLISKYPDKKITLATQISIDGPEYITDRNRGNGVTKKALENILKVKSILNDMPANMPLFFSPKPTVDINDIRSMVSKDSIINYYKFFEDNIIDHLHSKNSSCFPSALTLAVPFEFTVQDGKDFAEFCKMCREIEIENEENEIFKYYKVITPYKQNKRHEIRYDRGYEYCGGTCGSGVNDIMLLPEGKSSGCHRHFIDIIGEYKDELNKYVDNHYLSFIPENKHNQLFFSNKNELDIHKDKISQYVGRCTTSSVSTVSTLIRVLASVGQIDKKYSSQNGARIGAINLLSVWSPCISDNIVMTNSITGTYTGMIKLLLNGAIDYILE